MKKITLMLLAAALSMPLVAMAQPEGPEGGPPQGPPPGFSQQDRSRMIEARLNRLDRSLKLTDAQKTKIRKILEDEQASASKLIEEMRARQEKSDDDGATDRRQMREQMRALRAECNSKIRETLTAEQQKKFDELVKKQRGDRDGGPGAPPPDGGGPDGPGGEGPGGGAPDGGAPPM